MNVLAGARSTDAPMTFLRSFGSKADLVLPLTWGLTAISILVIVIVSALLLRALYASPALAAKPNQPLPVERPSGGLAWIYVGTAISASCCSALQYGPWSLWRGRTARRKSRH